MTRALEALALGLALALLTGIILDRPAIATPPSTPDPEPSWQPVPAMTEASESTPGDLAPPSPVVVFVPDETQPAVAPSAVPPTPLGRAATPTVAAARAYAKAAIGAAQFACLDRLWQRESNWNPLARNPSSGAYGIPQAYPASKMATAGADWRYNPLTQVRWGLTYIRARYGAACAAWSHFLRVRWY